MNYESLYKVYILPKSSVMWIIILGIILLILLTSIIISIIKKRWCWFGGILALLAPFIFIGIMGFLYPLPGTYYTTAEMDVINGLSMTYNKMSGAYENSSLIFYKGQTYNIICKDIENCSSVTIEKFTTLYMDIDEAMIDTMMELNNKVKKGSTITVTKDRNRIMVTYDENTKEIKFEIDLREHYLGKDKKEYDETIDGLELSLESELDDEYSEYLIEIFFKKSLDKFDISKESNIVKYTLKAE